MSGNAAQFTAWKFSRPATTQLVNHPRDDFLAGAGGPENQDGDVRLGGGADPLEDDEHLLVAADHFAEALNRRRLVLEADVRAPLEERIEETVERRRSPGGWPKTAPGSLSAADDAEFNELAKAVLDVQAHAPERRHQ